MRYFIQREVDVPPETRAYFYECVLLSNSVTRKNYWEAQPLAGEVTSAHTTVSNFPREKARTLVRGAEPRGKKRDSAEYVLPVLRCTPLVLRLYSTCAPLYSARTPRCSAVLRLYSKFRSRAFSPLGLSPL
jgi:hypothetical protein